VEWREKPSKGDDKFGKGESKNNIIIYIIEMRAQDNNKKKKCIEFLSSSLLLTQVNVRICFGV
jgi:hypothetical protein